MSMEGGTIITYGAACPPPSDLPLKIYRETVKSAPDAGADFVVSNLTMRRESSKEGSTQFTVMEKIIFNRVTRCDEKETELELTVRGHKVTGLFPATPKPGIYRSIKSILIGACITNNSIENMQKI